MNKLTQRVVALLLGTVLTGVLGFAAVVVLQPPFAIDVLPEWIHQVTIPLSRRSHDAKCEEQPEALRVCVGVDQCAFSFRLVKRDMSVDRTTLRAEFSGPHGDERVVVFFVSEQYVTIRAFFETDEGRSAGRVDATNSSVHMHADKACFDLSVQPLSSSSTRERWIGHISLL
jgi:hypothetical protein